MGPSPGLVLSLHVSQCSGLFTEESLQPVGVPLLEPQHTVPKRKGKERP